jgi:hypothetical protein
LASSPKSAPLPVTAAVSMMAVGDEAIGAVPQLAILGGDGDEADGRIALALSPGFVEIGPQVVDLGAVTLHVEDGHGLGFRHAPE